MPELVGRDRELGQLDDLWEAVQAGRGRIAVVTAEAGGGKTTLLQCWTERLPDDVEMRCGECQDGEGAPPFWPWLAILGHGEAADALAAASSSEAERFAAFRTAAEGLTAREAPAVVVLDDLHWADGASQRFLEFLAPLVRRSKLLLIVASRPRSEERRVGKEC